jgi:hypothetical protein
MTSLSSVLHVTDWTPLEAEYQTEERRGHFSGFVIAHAFALPEFTSDRGIAIHSLSPAFTQLLFFFKHAYNIFHWFYCFISHSSSIQWSELHRMLNTLSHSWFRWNSGCIRYWTVDPIRRVPRCWLLAYWTHRMVSLST